MLWIQLDSRLWESCSSIRKGFRDWSSHLVELIWYRLETTGKTH